MSSRSALSPYGGAALSVDKMIGDAFPDVKHVADNMDMVTVVAEALTGSSIGDPLISYRGVLSFGPTGPLGSTVLIPIEDLDVTMSSIKASNVKLIGNTGKLYFADSGMFTAHIVDLALSLTVLPTASADCAGAFVEWTVFTKGS